MKHTTTYLHLAALALMALCLSACGQGSSLPEATGAAWELYQQYAGRENLTVAFVGDYDNGGDTYNAVMLQAETDEAWEELQQEFSVVVPVGAPQEGDTVSPMMMAAYMADSALLQDSASLDSLVNAIVHNVVPDSLRTSRRVSTLVLDDPAAFQQVPLLGQHKRLIAVASADDKCGYLVSSDEEQHILWLFFYASQDELNRIITKIGNKQQ